MASPACSGSTRRSRVHPPLQRQPAQDHRSPRQMARARNHFRRLPSVAAHDPQPNRTRSRSCSAPPGPSTITPAGIPCASAVRAITCASTKRLCAAPPVMIIRGATPRSYSRTASVTRASSRRRRIPVRIRRIAQHNQHVKLVLCRIPSAPAPAQSPPTQPAQTTSAPPDHAPLPSQRFRRSAILQPAAAAPIAGLDRRLGPLCFRVRSRSELAPGHLPRELWIARAQRCCRVAERARHLPRNFAGFRSQRRRSKGVKSDAKKNLRKKYALPPVSR